MGLSLYCAVLFLVAIDPLVNPHMPDGRRALFAAIPLSYHLLDCDIVDFILFVLIWLPWLALVALATKFPRWQRQHSEWERNAVIRRARKKARRARARMETGW